MRDPELLIQMLKEMSEDVPGRIHAPIYAGGTGDDYKRRHHVELLVDAGHAEWVSKHMARITMDGYDFLNACDKQPEVRTKFLSLCKRGLPYVKATIEAIKVFEKLMLDKM